MYPAVIIKSAIDQLENSTYGNGRVLRLDCQLENILDEDGAAVVIDVIANPILTPRSKLWGWCEKLGFRPEIGMQLDTDSFQMKRCWVQVVDKRSKDGTTVFSTIEDLMYGPAMGSTPPPATEAPRLLNPDGSVDFNVFWSEAARRGISQTMVKAQLETADLNELVKLPPLDVLELLTILQPQGA